MSKTDKTETKPRVALLGLALAAALTLGACNTIEGAGQDIESTGDAISDAAK